MGLCGAGCGQTPNHSPFLLPGLIPTELWEEYAMDIPLWEGEGLSCGVRLQKYPQAATKFGVLGCFGGGFMCQEFY